MSNRSISLALLLFLLILNAIGRDILDNYDNDNIFQLQDPQSIGIKISKPYGYSSLFKKFSDTKEKLVTYDENFETKIDRNYNNSSFRKNSKNARRIQDSVISNFGISEVNGESSIISQLANKRRVEDGNSSPNGFQGSQKSAGFFDGFTGTTIEQQNQRMNKYSFGQDKEMMRKYCYEYKESEYTQLDHTAEVKHKPYDGNIIQGAYGEWRFYTNVDSVHEIVIDRTNITDQIIDIYLEGPKGDSLTVLNEEIELKSYKIDVLNASKIKVMVLQTSYTKESSYEVSITEVKKTYYTFLIGLISILLAACVMLILCTCLIAVGKTCIKNHGNNMRRVRQIRDEEEQARQESSEKLKKILEENPPLFYKNIAVKFDQINGVICLDDFDPSKGDKVRMMPEGNHVFHSVGIEKWFESKRNNEINCPLGNIKLLTKREILRKLENEEFSSIKARQRILERNLNRSNNIPSNNQDELSIDNINSVIPSHLVYQSRQSINPADSEEESKGSLCLPSIRQNRYFSVVDESNESNQVTPRVPTIVKSQSKQISKEKNMNARKTHILGLNNNEVMHSSQNQEEPN